MITLELEKTYLAKALPANLADCHSEIIQDVYVPQAADHPILRLRHRGQTYEITKKLPVDDADNTRQNEHTISLTSSEYDALAASSTKSLTKRRYYCKIEGHDAEVDVYQGSLAGLVVIDFEFKTDADMDIFTVPDICLADVSQDELIAAGKLAGKSYADIETQLQQYNYKPLFIKTPNTNPAEEE